MNNFYHVLPLPIECMRNVQINSRTTTWLSGQAGVKAYWLMRAIKIDIFAQIALSSANIGLEKDYFEAFSCDKLDPNCICALPIEQRVKNYGLPFLKANCNFASLTLNGPFLNTDDLPDTPFEDRRIGFDINFNFNWKYGITSTTNPQDEDASMIGIAEAAPIEGTSVPIYTPQIDTQFSPDEIKYIKIDINYLY